jgi:hypothetical protein
VAVELDQPLRLWMLHLREHQVALMEGRFDNARSHAEACHRFGVSTEQPDTDEQFVVQQFWIDYEVAPREWAEAVGRFGLGALDDIPTYAWAPTLLLCTEVGMVDEAAPLIDRLKATAPSALPRDQMRLWLLCVLAECAVRLGDLDWAGALAAELVPHADAHANVVFTTMGSVERYLGLVAAAAGDHQAAADHLERAVAANDALGAVTWATRSRLDLADALTHLGRPADAEPQRAEAAEAISRLGLARLRRPAADPSGPVGRRRSSSSPP